MGTYVTEDFIVPVGETLEFEINSDNFIASAFAVGDWNAIVGQIYYEPTVINRGELVLLQSPGLVAGSLFDYNSGMGWDDATFENFGVIRANLPEMSWGRIINANSRAPDIFNYGNIDLSVRDDATVMRVGAGFRLYNGPEATIHAEGNGRAFGFDLYGGGTITNEGTITVHTRGGMYHSDTEAAFAIVVQSGLGLDNSGLIEATRSADYQPARAIYAIGEVPLEITNSGTIRAVDAIYMRDIGNIAQNVVSFVNNSGLIEGNITFIDGHDRITNTGRIVGDVALGDGSNVFDSRTGEFAGSITSGIGVDWLAPGAGVHAIDAGSNVDTVVLVGVSSAYTITQVEVGVFEIVSADGTNTLTNVEYVQFDDELLRLHPGDGVFVDFEASDPGVYQAAMSRIRDFDGNDLGGGGSWLRIGSVDINGDGDIDQIVVNDAIGRFATVGTAPDGQVYFEDYSWAGETRVAGIYRDPNVTSGNVVAGSDNDSQRRFQNDLEIENINRVLGSDDYNGDGIWEVYLALTDGTAYLRALMHEDGNIRYANYQSEQEVIDYLTANGYDDSTFGDWFTSTQAAEASVVFAQSAGAPLPLAAPEVIQPRPSEDWQAEYFG